MRKRLIPLDYKGDQRLSSVKDEAASGASILDRRKSLVKSTAKRNKPESAQKKNWACFEYKKELY